MVMGNKPPDTAAHYLMSDDHIHIIIARAVATASLTSGASSEAPPTAGINKGTARHDRTARALISALR